MIFDALEQEIAARSPRPKGIKVGTELWKELLKAERIKWQSYSVQGTNAFTLDLPMLDNDIFVHVDPELDDTGHRLPDQ